MEIRLQEIEPFNIPPARDADSAQFLAKLTGSEEFTFAGSQKPLSMMLYEVHYSPVGDSYARGFLLSTTIDGFERACASAEHENMQPILERYVVGRVSIEYEASRPGARIKAAPFSMGDAHRGGSA